MLAARSDLSRRAPAPGRALFPPARHGPRPQAPSGRGSAPPAGAAGDDGPGEPTGRHRPEPRRRRVPQAARAGRATQRQRLAKPGGGPVPGRALRRGHRKLPRGAAAFAR